MSRYQVGGRRPTVLPTGARLHPLFGPRSSLLAPLYEGHWECVCLVGGWLYWPHLAHTPTSRFASSLLSSVPPGSEPRAKPWIVTLWQRLSYKYILQVHFTFI